MWRWTGHGAHSQLGWHRASSLRLATTDFIVVIKIKDLWGAIATGFVLQGFGYPAPPTAARAVGALR
jgi:hypothetical protein